MRPSDLAMDDAKLMREAIGLASGGLGSVSPNPTVGCLIVRDGMIVGTGCHERYGGPHAEANALAEAGSRAAGATAYVTLEPCNHFGKTPPCSRALIDAGIARAVVAVEDPHAEAAGGIVAMREAGIEVTLGVERSAAVLAAAPYLKWVRTGRPVVHLKVASTLDGRIAGPVGRRDRITGIESRRVVQRLRAESDAVMVGYRTVHADDPLLLPAGAEARGARQPLRVVLDPHCSTSPGSQLARTAEGGTPVLALVGPGADASRRRAIEAAGVETCQVASAAGGGLDLGGVLDVLGERSVQSVLVEPGLRLATALVAGGRVDRLSAFIAPRLMGADGMSMLGELGLDSVERAIDLVGVSWASAGADAHLSAWMPGLAWLRELMGED